MFLYYPWNPTSQKFQNYHSFLLNPNYPRFLWIQNCLKCRWNQNYRWSQYFQTNLRFQYHL
jgi:hypothetical protein